MSAQTTYPSEAGILDNPAIRNGLLHLSGVLGLFAIWWVGGVILRANPNMVAFHGFAPGSALAAFGELIVSGDAWQAGVSSLKRIFIGLFIAFAIGAPIGVWVGLKNSLETATYLPFQFLRMISPLSWMPIAVLVYPTWDSAIIFLVVAAAIWPIVFAAMSGVKRIDPAWIIAGKTHGGSGAGLLRRIIIPAIRPDLISGLRVALGTAWIIIVPAEFLGVTSGLGYAINDARDTLSYDVLAALVIFIGIIGFILDYALAWALKKTRWTPAF